MQTLALFAALFSVVAAIDTSPVLRVREIVKVPCSEYGEKTCGDGCIPLSSTCCPDGSGGCPSSTYCDLATNGKYGCCPNGENCQGPANPTTYDYTYTTTSTSYHTESSTWYYTEHSTSTIHVPTYTTSTTHGTGIPHPSIPPNGTVTVGPPPPFTGGAEKRSTISGLYVIEGLISGFLVLQSLI